MIFNFEARGQAQEADEAEVRAAIVFNLTKFIDWPASKTNDSAAPFSVCVLGTNPSVAAIDKVLPGKTVDGRSIAIRRLSKNDDGVNCQMLYVVHSERRRFEELQSALAKASVVTVGDEVGFASIGGIVGLPLTDGRIRIEINLAAAQRSNLSISSKLLRLATVMR